MANDIVENQQLDFFKLQDLRDHQLSQTGNIYDIMPKYVIYTERGVDLRKLPMQELIINRQFKEDGINYNLEIQPAVIKIKEGDPEKEIKPEYSTIYANHEVEVIEDCLRKMAVDGRIKCDLVQGCIQIEFTLYQLFRELERTGHYRNYKRIKAALAVAKSCGIELSWTEGGESCKIYKSGLFQSLWRKGTDPDKEEDLALHKGKNHKYLLRFHELMTADVLKHDQQQINYSFLQYLGNNLQKWFYRRLCYKHRGVSEAKNYYQIGTKTGRGLEGVGVYSLSIRRIKKSSCLPDKERPWWKEHDTVKTALKEMIHPAGKMVEYEVDPTNGKFKKNADGKIKEKIIKLPEDRSDIDPQPEWPILEIHIEKYYNPHNTRQLTDVKYFFIMTQAFIHLMKKGNAEMKVARRAKKSGFKALQNQARKD